jgi:lysophospholipase L1-like esterase
MKWTNPIVVSLEAYYSATITTAGLNGHKPMAVGSSRIIPLINNDFVGQQLGNSIYERVDDAHFYSPEIIFLMGGTNDAYPTGCGTIADEVYTGDAVTENPPSFYSAYKGTLKKLTEQNPDARIVCLTPLYSIDVSVAQKEPYITAVMECAALYGLEALDLFHDVGIDATNYATYLADGVHPNDAGGLLIGNYIASQL